MQNQSISMLNEQLNQKVDGNQFVTFSIDEEEFGIEIIKVQEIIGYTKPTHIPNIPDFVSGVINLRGLIIPVIDLRKRFGMHDKEYDKYTVIVIVEVATKIVGLIVDAVSDVLTLTGDAMQDVPEFSNFKSEYLRGMGKVGEKLILLLNVDKILTYNEYKQIHEINEE